MLRFQISNQVERQQLEHAGGPIEFGRGPRRDVPRCTIRDGYVSKDHMRVEELPNGDVRVENLSQKQPIIISAREQVPPGAAEVLAVPLRLRLGDTTIDVEPAFPETPHSDQLQTIAVPVRARPDSQRLSLTQLGGSPAPEVLAQWFETVLSVQRAAAGSPEFYQQTAQALVDLVGMDRGLVLLRQGDAWQVAATAMRGEGGGGRLFSHT